MAQTPTNGGARRRRPLAKLAIVLCTLVGGGLLAEGAYRIWRSVQGRPYNRHATEDALLQALGAARSPIPMPADLLRSRTHLPEEPGVILHPYLGYDSPKGIEASLTDLRNIRSQWGAKGFPILVVGGSVAGIFTQLGRDRLIEVLSKAPRFAGRQIFVMNQCRGGFKQPQQAMVIAYLLGLGFEPEMVINIDGFNEVALSNYNAKHGSNPTYPSLSHWGFLTGTRPDRKKLDLLLDLRASQRRVESLADFALEHSLCASALLGMGTLKALHRVRSAENRAYETYSASLSDDDAENPLTGPAFDPADGAVFDLIVKTWQQQSRSIHAMCADRGIPYLHVLQPTLHDGGAKPVTDEERRSGVTNGEWIEGVEKGYPRLRNGMKELAAHGVETLDASLIFKDIPETLYYDSCHFAQRGNDILAEHIATRVLEVLADR